MAAIIHRPLGALVCGAILASSGCKDEPRLERVTAPQASVVGPPEYAGPFSSNHAYYWKLTSQGYWSDTMVVYDKSPHLGINAHQTGEFGDAAAILGSQYALIRHTIPWDNADTARARMHQALAALPSGARLMITMHDPRRCITGSAPDFTVYAQIGALIAELVDSGEVNGRAPYWELGNEQNAETGATNLFGGFSNDDASGCSNGTATLRKQGENYGKFLETVYPMIKQANPNAVVIVGGLTKAGNWQDFVKGIYDANARRFFDAMGFHPYNCTSPESFELGGQMRNLMDEHGDWGKPLWATEWGYDPSVYVDCYHFLPSNHPGKVDGNDDGAYFNNALVTRWGEMLTGHANGWGAFTKFVGFGVNHSHQEQYIKELWANTANPTSIRDTAVIIRRYGAGLTYTEGGNTYQKAVYGSVRDRNFNLTHHAGGRKVAVDVEINGKTPLYRHCPIGTNKIRMTGIPLADPYPTPVVFQAGGATSPPAGKTIVYRAHVTGIGWMGECEYDGEVAGTTGESRMMEGIEISLVNPPAGMSIQYRAYGPYGDGGADAWQPWVSEGRVAGTEYNSPQPVPLKALQIQLINPQGWTLCYQAHIGYWGWEYPATPTCNGAQVPNPIPNPHLHIEAIKIWLIPPS